MENSPEVTLEQMSETRSALTEKLNALEDQVLGTVQDTKQSVADTVETVKDAVESTVTSIKDNFKQGVECVQESLNLSRHVRNYPWLALGGAVAAGFLSGRLLPDAAPAPARLTPSATNGYGGQAKDSVSAALGEPLHKLAGLAIGAAMGLVGEMIREMVPPTLKQQLSDVLDEATVNLGGKPVHGLWHLDRDHDARAGDEEAVSQTARQW